MIVVDDSHSMSESCCGDVAIEALVIVCPVVSQLEMGSLVVASFGTKGNKKLLHDFDKPFTGKVSVKVIRIYNLTYNFGCFFIDIIMHVLDMFVREYNHLFWLRRR